MSLFFVRLALALSILSGFSLLDLGLAAAKEPTRKTPEVVPVVILASDYKNYSKDPILRSQVHQARTNFASIVIYVREWYSYHVGRSFMVSNTLYVQSKKSSDEWLKLSELSDNPAHRFDFYYAAIDELKHLAGDSFKKYVATIFVGNQPDAWLGAADGGGISIIPPRAASISCPEFTASNDPPIDTRCADSIYAVAHELGHSFGLKHSCDVWPEQSSCQNSFMQTGKPPHMVILNEEREILGKSPFIF